MLPSGTKIRGNTKKEKCSQLRGPVMLATCCSPAQGTGMGRGHQPEAGKEPTIWPQ